jgi:fatty-acyl-CoA synthase
MAPRIDLSLREAYWPADTSQEVWEITLGDLLRQAASEVPERVALVEGVADRSERRRWTYAELLREAQDIARALLARFVPGERVALYAPNCAEWVLLQHATSLAGLVLVPLNPAYKEDEVAVILGNAQASGVFYASSYRDNDTAAIVAALAPRLEHLREAFPLAELRALGETADPATPLPDLAPGEVLQIQYTSGTTGVPKGALLHHRGVINTSRYVADRAGFPDGGVWVNAMPMFHIGGAAVAGMGCLSRRGTFVLAPGFDPGGLLELLESERGNVTLIVPTMILAVLDHPSFPERDLSSMTTVLSGAAAVPGALVRRTTEQIGCGFSILFGQTEINGVVCQTRLDDDIRDQAETLGQPLPNAEVKIADPVDGAVMAIGEVGEICVRGYQTMQGYYGMAQETSAAIGEDGWLRTGDLGVMDERGYVKIAGRLKDMIIRGGMNLFPREIEEVIFDHPDVAQASVIGVPDERLGEVVAAVVLPRDPAAPPDPGELAAFCRERLARHKAPALWFFVEEYPLTPSGKVQKFKLQELVASGAIAGHAAA